MALWLRLFLSIVALVGLLASTPGQAFASKMHHAHHAHHDCCPGMAGAHHGQQQDRASLPDCCVVGFCACPVAAPAPSRRAELHPASFSLVSFVALRNDAGLVGQSRLPDLRPPIA